MLTRSLVTVHAATARHWVKDDRRAFDVGCDFESILHELAVFLDRHATQGALLRAGGFETNPQPRTGGPGTAMEKEGA